MAGFRDTCVVATAGTLAVVIALLLSCSQDPPPQPPSFGDEPPATSQPIVAWAGIDLSGKALYSQHNEELITRDFFQDRRDEFFLDVGCFTPVIHSNTGSRRKPVGKF